MSGLMDHGWAVGAVAALAFVLTSGVAANGQTTKREDVGDKYKWDVSDIYADWDAWESDFAQLEKKMDEYAALKGTLGQGAEQLLHAHQLYDELDMITYKVYRYPQLQRDLDTRVNETSARFQRVLNLLSKFEVATAWFTPEMLAIGWEKVGSWLESTSGLAPYRHNIENTFRQLEHVLDEDKEKLLSYFGSFTRSPGAIYSELSTSDIQYAEATLSEGDPTKVTPGLYYYTLSTNRNQDDRRKAFETFYGVYNEYANTYASIYNSILQRDWGMAQARNYGSCLEASVDDDNVPAEVFTNLIKRVRDGAGPVHRYLALRKEALGLETYHGYDGSIPVVDFDKTYDYDEAAEWVIESVAPLGEDYQKRMRQIFENRWIDVYEGEGKRTGAYNAGVYGVHPYLLLNFNGTLDHVFTLAHEIGHCMHSLLAHETQPYATADYTIFVAEVASTLNEALFLDYMYERTDDPVERVALLQHSIENIIGTFYTQVMFADFEWQAHQMVERGEPITADALRELYTRLWKAQQGDAVTFDEPYGATWSRIGHFYRSPFYVYKYATCFASAAKLVQGITAHDPKVRDEAREKYLTLLKSGGNDYPMELLKKAGVDLIQPDVIQAVIDQLDGLVTRLEGELAKL